MTHHSTALSLEGARAYARAKASSADDSDHRVFASAYTDIFRRVTASR